MVIDWSVAFQLSDDSGTLDLNTTIFFPQSATTGRYILNPGDCKSEIPLRVTDTNLPQSDGIQTHSRFFAGYLMTLAVQLWQADDNCAGGELVQEMADTLLGHIREFQNASDGRVYWTPNGQSQRMIKDCLLSEYADITLEEGGVTQIAFQVVSMLPYEVDASTGVIPIA
jgi:hypothetical protein